MSIFSENFWGERNHGYDTLYHNMKHGQTSSKDLADFVRERASIEDSYSKNLTKLAKNVSNPSLGTFSPLWSTIKTSSEKLASLHAESAKRLYEIVKELQKYSEEQHKKHKSAKDEFSGTAEVVGLIQTMTTNLQKAKETYNSRSTEYEKIRKEGASQRELEKAESKYKKASEDYKSLVEKYGSVRTDFITKMTCASEQFQQLEEAHLTRMKDLLKDYNSTFIQGNSTVSNILKDFEQQCGLLTIEKLIMEYVESKRTGTDRPGEILFEECPITIVPSPEMQLGQKDKSKKKKDKRKKKKDKEQTPDGNSRTPEVDEEGFSIRPQEINAENKRDSFYSESDSDSDQEEQRGKKIHVEIKPVASTNSTSGTSSSVDQLRASVTGISLTPSPTIRKNGDQKLSILTEAGRKPSADLLDLNLFSGGSSGGVLSPPSSLTSPSSGIDSWNSSSNGVTPPSLPIKQSKLNSTSSLSEVKILPPGGIPRPPSRNRGIFGQTSISPVNEVASLPRKDSFPSMSTSFDASGATVGASRGPSPLTLGMADTIPMAAAFIESVNAYFRGTDTSKCMVKITGELVLSFPAGIIQALTNNPSPAVISFKVKNFNNLEQILPNKQLISLDAAQSTADTKIYSFNMAALTTLLKRQSDQNAAATYFNVDIIKYQVKCLPGAHSVPLHLSTYWKCEAKLTELRVDYCYNQVTTPPAPLTDVQMLVPVDGGVTIMQSRPPATWSAENHRVLWKINRISKSGDPQVGDSKAGESQGSLRAKFELTEGPSKPATMAVQFQSEGSTISGLDIELLGTAYRLSLVKKKFHSGKVLSDR